MKLNLVWHVSERWDDIKPGCSFSEYPENFKQCLASLLNDDGGSSNFSYADWVLIGLAKIRDVKNHTVQSEDWSSNSWGALISNDQVKN